MLQNWYQIKVVSLFPWEQLDQQASVQQTGPILHLSAPHHHPPFSSSAAALTHLTDEPCDGNNKRETTFPNKKAVTGTSFGARKHVHSVGDLRLCASL